MEAFFGCKIIKSDGNALPLRRLNKQGLLIEQNGCTLATYTL